MFRSKCTTLVQDSCCKRQSLVTIRSLCLSSSHTNNGNDKEYCCHQLISKRYRKKPPKTYWRRMWVGHNPFGPPKGREETSEEKKTRADRILRNRRGNGRNFMDWLYMPHLQHMLYFDPNLTVYYENGAHMSKSKIEKNYQKYLTNQSTDESDDNTNNENESGETSENANANENENENEKENKDELYDTEFNYDYTQNSDIAEYELDFNPYEEEKLLEELNNDAKYSKTDNTIRMMRDKWFMYPESCYWTVVRVDPGYRHPQYINGKENPYFGKIVKARAYGRLTWRNEEETDIKPIPDLRRRGWVWVPCENWTKHELTTNAGFEPQIRRYGKFSFL